MCALYIALSAFALFAALPFLICAVSYRYVFGGRTDKHHYGLHPVLNDFPGLERENFSVDDGRGARLSAFIYKRPAVEQLNIVAVVAHGLGGMHDDYLNVIDRFACDGFTVVSYDNTGCGASEGKSRIGLTHSAVDLCRVLDSLRRIESFAHVPVCLFGHSWGGYAVCAALGSRNDIAAVASCSGFDSSRKILAEKAAIILKPAGARLLAPYFSLLELIRLGRSSRVTASESISRSNAHVLLLHSIDDAMVGYGSSIAACFAHIKNENVYAHVFSDRRHHVFYSDKSIETRRRLNALIRKHKHMDFPYTLDDIYGLDTRIMGEITNLFVRVCKTSEV